MSWRRALTVLAIAAFAGLCALLVARQIDSDSAQPQPPVATTARIANRVTTPPQRAPALTTADLARINALGASPNTGPGVAVEGDFSTGTPPSAQALGVQALPVDWMTALLTADVAAAGMGTPLAERGEQLQGRVTPEIYQRWVRTLTNRKSAGVFALDRLYLASPDQVTPNELALVGIGSYRAQSQAPRTFVVNTTVSRLRPGWVVTSIEFSEIGN